MVPFEAIKGDDTSKRKDPVRTYVKRLEEQGMFFDHTGKLELCVEALSKEKGIHLEYATELLSYLTGYRGYFRT